MTYKIARTLDEAVALNATPGARIVAGGTDVYPSLVKGQTPAQMVDVSRVAEMRGISHGPDGWRIGGAVTWSELIAAKLPPAFDGLKAAAREVGSVQIQNTGTLAGNLCNASPAADGVPPLLTLDANVVLTSARGERHLPLGDFLLGVRQTALAPGEVLAALHIPAQPDGALGAFRKLGSRRYLVISITMVAGVMALNAGRISAIRLAIGACSPVAARQPGLEAMLLGQDPSVVFVSADQLAGLSPIADVRGTPDYRIAAAAAQCTDLIRGMVP